MTDDDDSACPPEIDQALKAIDHHIKAIDPLLSDLRMYRDRVGRCGNQPGERSYWMRRAAREIGRFTELVDLVMLEEAATALDAADSKN
jgi:hypothetical protein